MYIDNFASKVEIPSEWSTISVNYPYIPPLFIVNAQVYYNIVMILLEYCYNIFSNFKKKFEN